MKKLILDPEDDFLRGRNPYIHEDNEMEEDYDISVDTPGNLDRDY